MSSNLKKNLNKLVYAGLVLLVLAVPAKDAKGGTAFENIPVTTAEGNQTSPAIWGNYIVWKGAQNEDFDIEQRKIVEMTGLIIDGVPAIWDNKVVWSGSNGYYDIDLQQMVYPAGLSVGDQPAIHDNKIVWSESTGYYDLSLQEMVYPPGLSIGQYPDIFEDKIVWSQSTGYYDISLEAMVYPPELSTMYRPAIYGDKIIWMYNTEGVHYDISLSESVYPGPVTIRPPDIFEDKIVHTVQDVYLWDPICKHRKVTDTRCTSGAKIYNDIVVWTVTIDCNADIYMAKIPESCCGGTEHPYPAGDCDYDCNVNLFDLSILAWHWLEGTDEQPPDGEGPYGMPNPSSVYCCALGYKLKIVTEVSGGQYGVCIFPDGNECEEWAFYRGKAYQQWSYCKLYGYDLKDLEPHEGWVRGAHCIDRTTQEEIGNVYVLFVDEFMSKPKHYPAGDLSHDLRVNFIDLAILASHWLESTQPESD